MSDVKQGFDRLSCEAQDFLNLKIDEIKLSCVESLSLLFADVVSWLLVSLCLLLAFICLLVAGVVALSAVTGLVLSLVIAAAVLLVVMLLLYMLRRRLFTNIAVGRFCKMFFKEDTLL